MTCKLATIVVFLLSLTTVANAQTKLDLTTESSAMIEPADDLSFKLVNAVPDAFYKMSVRSNVTTIDPLSLDELKRSFVGNDDSDDECEQRAGVLIDELSRTSTESEVARLVRLALVSTNCKDTFKKVVEQFTTRDVPGVYGLRPGRKIEVLVERISPSGDVVYDATYAFSAEPYGEWRLLYGFNFLRDHEDRYFTEQSDANPEEFVVREEDERKGFEYAPSILYGWFPYALRWQGVSLGAVGGFGYDFSDLVVLAGGGLAIGDNITLTGGATLHQQDVLRGRYSDGDAIETNLTPDQLLEDRFRMNWYAGIAFRLKSNPFRPAADETDEIEDEE